MPDLMTPRSSLNFLIKPAPNVPMSGAATSLARRSADIYHFTSITTMICIGNAAVSCLDGDKHVGVVDLPHEYHQVQHEREFLVRGMQTHRQKEPLMGP